MIKFYFFRHYLYDNIIILYFKLYFLKHILANFPNYQILILIFNKKGGYIIQKLLNPKNDYVFKRLFGYKGSEKITQNFLQSILDFEISNVDLDKNTEKRILFYWSKLYYSGISKGEDYSKLKPAIAIIITDYSLKSIQKIPKYLTNWQIREKDFCKEILTSDFQLSISELTKYRKFINKHNNKNLEPWLNFIINPEDNTMKNKNPHIEKAKELLEEISSDEHERYLADLREKYIRDQIDIEAAGFDKGLEAGIEQGLEQGSINKSIEIAKKLLNQNIDINVISSATSLTIHEIKNLK